MDVAALSLSIDSSTVVTAANDLDRFADSAKRAGAAASPTSGSIAKLVASVQSMDAKLNAIIGSLDKATASEKALSAANDNTARSFGNADAHVTTYRQHLETMVISQKAASTALVASDAHVVAYTQHLAAMASAQRDANAHVLAYRQSLQGQASSQTESNAHIVAYRESLGKVAEGANSATTAIRFTAREGLNASRQLADIGVTAASGMSPFLIAVQQGPQLFDILQEKAVATGTSVSAVFRAAAASILAMLAPLAPLIAVLALAAAGIAALAAQANDDSGLKKYTTAMGYTKAEVAKLNAVTVTWGDTAKAVFQVGWERIANAFGITTDDLSKKWSSFTDWLVTAVRFSLAGVYAAFTGLQNVIPRILDNIKTGKKESLLEIVGGSFKDQYREAQKFMDDVVGQSQKNARDRQDKMAKAMYDKPREKKAKDTYGFDDLLKDAAKTENDLNKARMQIGLYGEALARVTYEQDLLNKASEHGLKLSPAQRASISGIAADLAKLSEANRLATFREDTKQAAIEEFAALQDASAQIGIYNRDLSALRHEQEMLKAARGKNALPLTDNDRQVISSAANALADKEYQNLLKQADADRDYSHNVAMRQLDAERGALGLGEKAAIAYAYAQQEINRQRTAGVAEEDINFTRINRQADAYAEAKYAIDQQAKAIADAREVTKSFFSDWINGVREGGNASKAFADSAINSLNRIIDKLLDKTLNGFLDSIFAGGGGGLKAVDTSGWSAGNVTLNALGGAYGTAERFAKGGAFTNTVVSQPTLFRFAKGAQLGEMGEAGPEAIMPLTRGPNGKLGVQSHGGGGKPAIRMGDVHNSFSFAGAVGLDGIASMVRQGGEATYNQVKRDLQTLLQQLDTDGSFAS